MEDAPLFPSSQFNFKNSNPLDEILDGQAPVFARKCKWKTTKTIVMGINCDAPP